MHQDDFSPELFYLYSEMNTSWDLLSAGSILTIYTTLLMADSELKLKKILDKVIKESQKNNYTVKT